MATVMSGIYIYVIYFPVASDIIEKQNILKFRFVFSISQVGSKLKLNEKF